MKPRARSRARFASTAEKLRTIRAREAIRKKSWSWRLSARAGKKANRDPRARSRSNSRQGTQDRVSVAGTIGHNGRFRVDRDCPVQLHLQSNFVGIAPL